MLMSFNNGSKKGWISNTNTTMPTPSNLNLGGLQIQILNCIHNEIINNVSKLTNIKLSSHKNAKIHIAEENNDWDSADLHVTNKYN